MEKIKIYETCDGLLKAGKTWIDIHKEVKRLKLITTKTTVNELKSVFRDVAGEVAVNGKPEEQSFDDHVAEFFRFIGKTRTNIAGRQAAKRQAGKVITGVISDVHVPYHDMDKILRAVDALKEQGATRLLIAGDFLNGTQLSSHPQLVFEDFKKELLEGRTLLEMFSADFPDGVIMTDDNHVHSRWQNYIAKTWRADLHFLAMHPYDYMTAGLTNVTRSNSMNDLGPMAEEFRKEFGWFAKIGDALFTHAEKHSANEFKMVRDIGEWFRKWEPILNLGPIRVIGQAHNHNVGMLHEADRILCFTGCMVGLGGLTYSMSAKAAGSPPCHGYVLLVQDENGVTDIEETRVVRLTY